MNKKIVSEFAIGIILLVAFIVGGIFWFNSVKEIAVLDKGAQQITTVKTTAVSNEPLKTSEQVAKDDASCKPHYYEGKVSISSWLVSESDDGIIIAIKKDEISKLPLVDAQVVNNQNNFTVKLIDPTDAVRKKIAASSAKKPATITLQGYAEVCQQPPLVSIQPAADAFKKRS